MRAELYPYMTGQYERKPNAWVARVADAGGPSGRLLDLLSSVCHPAFRRKASIHVSVLIRCAAGYAGQASWEHRPCCVVQASAGR